MTLASAVGIGLVGSVAGGPVVAYGLERLPHRWRGTLEWALIGGAGAGAVLAELLSPGPVAGPAVYVLAALPGLLAFLAWRTLVASTLVSLAPLYFVIGLLTAGRATHAPEIALDRALPLEPAWMLVYGSLYAFVVLLPLFVVRQPQLLRRAMQAFIAVMIVSYVGFLLYPTAGPRPAQVPGQGFFPWCLRLAYSLDTPYNCFPSLHVAYSFLSALACYRVHRGVGRVAAIWAALIGVSTLFTKQHYILDVVAGVLIASVAYMLLLRPYPREAVPDDDRRRAPARALAVVAIFGVIVAGFWTAYRIQLAAGRAVGDAERPRRGVDMSQSRSTSVIEQSRIIPALPAAVYRAIADPREQSAFTGARATGRARPGAAFTAWDGYINGRTLIATPGRRLVQEWLTTEWPAGAAPSRVEWRFRRHPRGTLVTLRHTGVPRSQAASYRKGWVEFYWRPLRAYLRKRHGIK